MIIRFLPVVLTLSCLFFGGCASQQVNPAVVQSVSSSGVAPSVTSKIKDGQALDYQDISELVSKRVPTHVITGYLESTQKVYNFSSAQLSALSAQGASPQLVNYLQESQGFYGRTTPQQTARTNNQQKAAYYNSPRYQDEQPFAYNQPIVDGFYDSGYEESLYSPFSFN